MLSVFLFIHIFFVLHAAELLISYLDLKSRTINMQSESSRFRASRPTGLVLGLSNWLEIKGCKKQNHLYRVVQVVFIR